MTLGDLLGRFDWLEHRVRQVRPASRYRVHSLAAWHGQDYKIPDWISDVTRDCPRKNSPGLADACGARCPGLPEIR
jgi:hypothetical protein